MANLTSVQVQNFFQGMLNFFNILNADFPAAALDDLIKDVTVTANSPALIKSAVDFFKPTCPNMTYESYTNDLKFLITVFQQFKQIRSSGEMPVLTDYFTKAINSPYAISVITNALNANNAV